MEKYCSPCGGMVNEHGACPINNPSGCPLVKPSGADKSATAKPPRKKKGKA